MKKRKETILDVCIRINIRDYPILEDLANDVGFDIDILNFNGGKRNITLSDKGKFVKRKRITTTQEFISEVKKAVKKMPDANPAQIKEYLNCENSRTTIGRIMRGEL